MQKHNLNVLIEYDEERFSPKVLMNEPGYRMVLLSLRARQTIPEHASKGMVTVYAILGHITLFAGPFPDELYAGRSHLHRERRAASNRSNRGFSSACSLYWRYGFLYGRSGGTGFVPGSETTTLPTCV